MQTSLAKERFFMEMNQGFISAVNMGCHDEIVNFMMTNEEGIYSGINEDGERAVILLDKHDGMEVITYQRNGWVNKKWYSKEGLFEGDTFDGRHDITYS